MKQTPFFFGFNHTLTRANYNALKQVARPGDLFKACERLHKVFLDSTDLYVVELR